MLIFLGVALVTGYIWFNSFFLESESNLDSKSAEKQEEVLLTSEEFKDLPEVIALKQQVQETNGKDETAAQMEGVKGTLETVPSQSDIESNLKQKLSSLQAEYNGRLAGLISAAQNEYKKLETGQVKESKIELAKKYITLADGLESQCDARVYAAITYAENELTRYGYDTGIAEEARKHYQQTKKERRNKLLNYI